MVKLSSDIIANNDRNHFASVERNNNTQNKHTQTHKLTGTNQLAYFCR